MSLLSMNCLTKVFMTPLAEITLADELVVDNPLSVNSLSVSLL